MSPRGLRRIFEKYRLNIHSITLDGKSRRMNQVPAASESTRTRRRAEGELIAHPMQDRRGTVLRSSLRNNVA